MKQPILKTCALTMLALAVAGCPTPLLAQTTSDKAAKPAAEKKTAADKKPSAGPFHGKLAAVDKIGKTITVGKRTFLITSETRMNKAGKPATLDDGVVGEEVSGYVKPNDEGKLVATKVNFGPKAAAKDTATEKKKTVQQ